MQDAMMNGMEQSMVERMNDDWVSALEDRLESRKESIYNQWKAVTDAEYAQTTVDENGHYLNDPYLTPGDLSRELGYERNRLRKLMTETFRDCLMDIKELEGDDSEKGLGKQSRAKTLLSRRDLEIMRIILSYKKSGTPEHIIKEEIIRRKSGAVSVVTDEKGKQHLPMDPAFMSIVRDMLVASGEYVAQKVDDSLESKIKPMQGSIERIESMVQTALEESVQKSAENERLKTEIEEKQAELDRKEAELGSSAAAIEEKEAELQRLKKESDEKIAALEADLADARSKKRPWFRPWW